MTSSRNRFSGRRAVGAALASMLVLATACEDEWTSLRRPDAAAIDARVDAGRGAEPDAAEVTPDAGDDTVECNPDEGTQLVENGDFDGSDANLEPWETSGEILFIQDDEDNPYSIHTLPNSVGHLTGVGGEGSARLEQAVDIPQGTTDLALQFFLCLQTEVIDGDPDVLTIALESEDGDELDVLMTVDSSEQNPEENCSYEPRSAFVDSLDYDGETVHLVVSAETDDNDQATFFLDTFTLEATCD